MAFLTGFEFDPTGDDIIDVMAGGVAWDVSASTTLTWAIADSLTGDMWPDRAAAQQDFEKALLSIQQFIDVEFSYLGAFSDPIEAGEAGADIVYSIDNLGPDDLTLAYAYFPGPGVFDIPEQYDTEGGDVFVNFNLNAIASSSFDPGSDGFLTLIHEIGHAMGLKHPFESTPGRPAISDLDRDDVIDIDWFTMMSYDDDFDSELERWDPATPMVLDVLALQYLYGPNDTTHAGDTTHALTSKDYYYAIWDASGRDVVSVAAESEAWTIALPELQLSDQVATRTGLAMPSAQYRETFVDTSPTELVWLLGDMEDAFGSQYGDTIEGNRLGNVLHGSGGDDTLTGGGGNDRIDGGDGIDMAAFEGAQRQYTLTLQPDRYGVTDHRSGADGSDTLVEIEFLSFGEIGEETVLDLARYGGAAGLSASELESFVELYIAYFNRAPDALGLNFWATAFANGLTLEQSARSFIDQAETRALYPETLSNAEFAIAVYDNVLGRAPDDAGLTFWTAALDSGVVGRDQFILQVLRGAKADPKLSLGPEFAAQQNADRDYLATKTDLGALYAVHYGLSDVDNAVHVMTLFDGSEAGKDAAVAAVSQYHAAALEPGGGEFLMQIVGVLDPAFDAIA